MTLKELFEEKGELITSMEISEAKLRVIQKQILEAIAARDAAPSNNGKEKDPAK